MRGQHFLVDGNLIDAIVRTAEVGPGDCVLEVGTGTGILTDALADRAGAVVSCDVDARIQEVAKGAREWPPSVLFLVADALAGKHRLAPAVLDAWTARGKGLTLRVVSNLPYGIATPFLANLLWEGIPARDAVVLVQREAAERFTAGPRTAAYGPLAVAVRLLADAEVLRRVPASVFWPEPKVESCLLRIRPRDPARAHELRRKGLPELLKEAFAQRRKTLGRRLGAERLAAAGIPPGARAEEVSPEQWVSLLTVPPP
jgi:16S rRNA (adenine1518-N6/adenine1519-N6)-dimethyltransferase